MYITILTCINCCVDFYVYVMLFVLLIFKAITNFVAYKFNNLPQSEWQMMYDLAKMFLYCFNHWKLETPTNHTHSSPTDDHKVYKENYTRQVYVYSGCGMLSLLGGFVFVMFPFSVKVFKSLKQLTYLDELYLVLCFLYSEDN